MSISLSELSSIHPMPGLALWKKDTQSVYLDANQEFADLFGFEKPEDALGKTDADVPCGTSTIVDIIQKEDSNVLTQNKSIKFLEFLKTADQKIKIFMITKTPFYQNHALAGTAAYCVEMPNSVHRKLYSLTHYDQSRKTKKLYYFIQ